MKPSTSKKSLRTGPMIKAEIVTKPEAAKDSDIRVLKSGACVSLSGKSRLNFEWGCTESKELRLRIVGNSGKGSFRQDWVDVGAIRAALGKPPPDETVTSDCLMPLFRRESANMPSFAFAVLLHEGLVTRSVREKRRYERAGEEAFDVFTNALVDGKSPAAGADARGRKAKSKTVAVAKPKNDKKNAKSA